MCNPREEHLLRRERARIARVKQVKFERQLLISITIFVLISVIIIATSIIANAQESNSEELNNYTYYKSIELEYGDTLWTIAEEIDYNNLSTKEIVKEIMKINQLKSSNIYANKNIIVPYTSTEYK